MSKPNLVARAQRRSNGLYSAHVQTPRGITLVTAEALFSDPADAVAWARAEIAGEHAAVVAAPAEPTQAERVAATVSWLIERVTKGAKLAHAVPERAHAHLCLAIALAGACGAHTPEMLALIGG